jgi:arylsulfatase A-like enzyme
MSPKQRKAWHQAYDPRNKRYRELEKQGKLKGDERNLYVYQRFIKDYVRCIDGLDAQVGRILRFLDEEKLAGNTLLVYSSDQGFFTGEHGWAEKRWMYEESFKSPLLVRWPGVIEPGSVIEDLVQNIDLAPTFLQAAGLDVPSTLHGLALQPLFSESGPKEWREEVLYQYFDGGTLQKPGPYNMPRHEGIRNRRYKLISFYEYDTWEFYDLYKDPNELSNLIGNSSMRVKIEEMKKRLKVVKDRFSP